MSSFHPPPGPPPGQQSYQPPPGPPPSQKLPAYETQSPPYPHNWTIIPDTSELPPPPSLSYEVSPAANASPGDAYRGAQWCLKNRLWAPRPLTAEQREEVQAGSLRLIKQNPYLGDVLENGRPGTYSCRTHASCADSILLTHLPAYSALHDSPSVTGRSKTIYFEIRPLVLGRDGQSNQYSGPQHEVTKSEKHGIKNFSRLFSRSSNKQKEVSSSGPSNMVQNTDSGIAIGYCAPPYPPFRLPGWHRGSLAVHSDDGHQYINNDEGGSDFTTPFYDAQVVGIGMTFSLPRKPPTYEGGSQNPLDIEVFFTRDGVKTGGWDGNAELDSKSAEGAVGLKGECDLFPVVGVFGGVDFSVVLDPSGWVYTPPE
ncbi:hypothetical protein EJ05DRAFT_475932 [Pseudovirgaria hyperparasitica]|uniref:SPRY domain-containing protein n=1 Tax=Pseudovirgaria hyperparasitica TaxID=470096 RepID=A0A6A6W9C7_9PEZI|nr:uncharacterized protein EJ05DRAFT_475932 [Pseudovirgaria hyperparasitica]KAF2758624.1 hypothetical protein EJ05DRAFT_475932 [Pseudovirgaria hyperparasitica]